jgi:hypothetical protein
MWKKITYRNYFLAAIIINLGVASVIVLLKSILPPLVPLFYGRPVGEAQLTGTFGLLIAPGVSLLITLLNILFSLWVKDDFLKKILAITGIIISVLVAITILKIIFLIGFF